MRRACRTGFNGLMDTTTTRSSRSVRKRSYPFQLRDPVSGRKVRARFLSHVKDIDGCMAAWEIVGGLRTELASV